MLTDFKNLIIGILVAILIFVLIKYTIVDIRLKLANTQIETYKQQIDKANVAVSAYKAAAEASQLEQTTHDKIALKKTQRAIESSKKLLEIEVPPGCNAAMGLMIDSAIKMRPE